MKKVLNLLLLLVLVVCHIHTSAQLTGFSYKTEYEITDYSGTDRTDFQVMIKVNTQDLYVNGMINLGGWDIRFAADCDGDVLYDYFIEDAVPSVDTRIWIKFPFIGANTTSSFYMFSGNPTAQPASDFDTTFPPETRFDAVNWELGLQTGSDFSWAEFTDDITLKRGQVFAINARRVKFNGAINGVAMGEIGGLAAGAGSGSGPGEGGTGGNGGGGAGHGGNGGNGGIGVPGGPSYGTVNAFSAELGSGGGAGGAAAGGNGGGAVFINAPVIDIHNDIIVTGGNGRQNDFSDPAGGGGSGGSIVIAGDEINITSNLIADGGNSGRNFGTSNGGGGAGGRIKIFKGSEYSYTGTYSVEGGLSGILSGSNGQNGSFYEGSLFSQEPVVTYIRTTPIKIEIETNLSNDSICNGDNGSIIADIGFNNYNFYKVGGGLVQTGGMNTYTASLNDGDQFYVNASIMGCSTPSSSDTVSIIGVDKTVASYTYLEDELNYDFTQTATGPVFGYAWDFGDGNTSIEENPSHSFDAPGTYTVTLTTFGELGCADDTYTEMINVTCTPPSPAFSYASDELMVSFSNESNDYTSIRWYSNDDPSFNSTEENPVHEFSQNGTYEVCIEITNDCQSVVFCKFVSVACTMPAAQFSVQVNELEIIATNESTDYEDVYWSTDGYSSYNNDIEYSYSDQGTYVLQLIVGNECGADTTTRTLVVNCDQIDVDFTWEIINGNQVDFTDLTNNAVQWEWGTSDGGNYTTQNPTHIFPSVDSFLVCLSAVNQCGYNYTKCHRVHITSLDNVSENERILSAISVYPNPAEDILYVKVVSDLNERAEIVIRNITGKEIFRRYLTGKQDEIDIRHLESGMYFIEVHGNGIHDVQSIVKN